MVKLTLVMKMETRVERSKRLAKSRMIKKLKILTIFLLVGLMVLGIFMVNEEARAYGILENPILINFDFQNKIFTFLGRDYYLDLQILKKQI